MRKMGKISLLLLSALFATLVLMPMVNPVQAHINEWVWLPPFAYKGYEGTYYDCNIVAYLNGTTASLKIPVENDMHYPEINVTAVSIVFTWGVNITKEYTQKIETYDTYIFEISFTADANQLPNVMAHAFDVYVKYEYGSTQGERSRSWTYPSPSYRFVVMLQGQKDAMDLRDEYYSYWNSYPPYYFEAIKASLLATQAVAQASQGENLAEVGNWTQAEMHYQTAVDLYEQAFAYEEDKGVTIEDANLNATINAADAAVKEADAAMLQAQASMNQAYGYLLLGLGFVLVGIGAIVYGARKPKTVQS